MIRLLVCGSRTLEDKQSEIEAQLSKLVSNHPIECVICGMARGVDMIAYYFFHGRGTKIVEFPANWKPNGVLDKRAGYIRNQQMLEDGNPTHVVAFQDCRQNSEGSKGTNHMIDMANKAGKVVKVIKFMR